MKIEYLNQINKLLGSTHYKLVGKDIKRLDTIDKVTGMGRYTADYILDDCLVVRPVRSPIPHGLVKQIKTESASKVSGVKCVLTAGDIPGVNQIGYLVKDQPLLTDHVRYVGDIVALIVAENIEAALEAESCLDVTYEELPALFDVKEALSNRTKIHGHGNKAGEVRVRKGNIEVAFKDCEIIVEKSYKAGSQDHAYLEPEAAIAIP